MTDKNSATAESNANARRARRDALCAIAAVFMLGAPGLPAHAADAIKVGVLLPLSGNFAANGQQTLTGIKMYFDSIHNEVAGHKIDLIVEDTQGKPDVAVTKARKEVERDGAQVLSGIVLSSEALAVNDYSRQAEVPLVLSGDAGVDEITMPGPLANPYLVRVSQNGRTVAAAAAEWAYKTKGWRKVAVLGSDYAGGVNVNYAFAQTFCMLGGKVIQEEWPPLNSLDYGPYLTTLDRSAEALVTFTPGADGLRLGQQYAQFGLKGKMPVLDIYAGIAYEPNLGQLGDAALGVYSSLFYTPMLKTPENEAFVAEFKKRMGSLPANEGPNGWAGAHAIADAVKAVNGDLKDKLKFMAALKAVKFASPKGEIVLDKYGQVIQTMYIREVEKVDGQLANVPIASYPHVDQFWPFTEAEYASYKYSWKEMKGSLTDCGKLLAKK